MLDVLQISREEMVGDNAVECACQLRSSASGGVESGERVELFGCFFLWGGGGGRQEKLGCLGLGCVVAEMVGRQCS